MLRWPNVRSSGGLKSPELEKISEKFLRFFGEKRPLMIKFSQLCSESLHRDTDRRRCVKNS